jgi:hypothetical protein
MRPHSSFQLTIEKISTLFSRHCLKIIAFLTSKFLQFLQWVKHNYPGFDSHPSGPGGGLPLL